LSLIPDSIWRDEKIRLPEPLVRALAAEMRERGCYEEACGPDPREKLIGGKSEKESVFHFTHRFKTSAARVQFVTLNPSGTFEPLACDLRGMLLDGRLSVLDLACGSGGGLLGLLATIAELRIRGCLPYLPLDIGLLAADCSPEGLSIHESMLTRVREVFASVGVRLRWEHTEWDVTLPLATTRLVDRWLEASRTAEEYVVLVSAFSGFMGADDQKSASVLEAISDIAKRLHTKTFLLAWIEPMVNESRKQFPKVLNRLASLLGFSNKLHFPRSP
jgi:hypothetical protein